MSALLKIMRNIEIKGCKIRHIGAYKKDIDLNEAWRILEEYSHNPKTSCYQKYKKIGMRYDLAIIVPVYMTEKYLSRCIDSILNQHSGYKVQCIFVNDGSPDNSDKILSRYEDVEGVFVIKQENKGFSGARNAGLDRVDAKYIMFVDSDDKLESNAIKNLLDTAFRLDADVVAGNYRTVNEDGKVLSEYKKYQAGSVKPEGNLYGQPWGKVYKSELFCNLRFPEGYWYEDSIFAQIVWPLTKKAFTISEIVYEYTINRKGISKRGVRKAKAIDSLYITAQLIEDRQKFSLPLSENNFAYFMRMVKLTYSRSRFCNGMVAKSIFLVQCELYKHYDGISSEENKNLQMALKTKDYLMYLRFVD